MTRWFSPPDTDEKPVDGGRILQTLAERWGASQTLEYRSLAIMSHAGEFRVQLKTRVQLRRPRLARLLWDADRPDTSRLRVCDGRALFDRTRASLLRSAQTARESLNPGTTVMQNIPHPLDEASYCVDQFFSPTPFYPTKTWGDGTGRVNISAMRAVALAQKTASAMGKSGEPQAEKNVFRVILESGTSRDILTLDAQNYAPLQIVRVAPHAGRVQEILRETFTDVKLGGHLPAELFMWTPFRDEAPSATYLLPEAEGAA